MDLVAAIKKVKEVEGMSQKEVALVSKIDISNSNRIEDGKTNPCFSSVVKITKALGVSLTDLFKADELFTNVNSFDKSLIEKMALVEQWIKKKKTLFMRF